MKILIIPDPHGQDNWKKAIEKFTYDKVVFMGDYFDNYNFKYQGEFALKNFKEICEFVRKDSNDRKMCIGNHDFDNYIMGGNCSGYQNNWYKQYKDALCENIDLLNICYEIDGYVFSHAGVSEKWIKELEEFDFDFIDKDTWKNMSRVDKINYIFHSIFENGKIKTSDIGIGITGLTSWFTYDRYDMSGYGESSYQSPLWIRPKTLYYASAFTKQVVGHTEYCLIDFQAIGKDGNYILITDSPTHEPGLFDTENPLKAKDIVEFDKDRKQIVKQLNDLKSLFGNDPDMNKFKKIKEEFGDKALFVYETYFKD